MQSRDRLVFPVPLLRAGRDGRDRMQRLNSSPFLSDQRAFDLAAYRTLYELAASAIEHRNLHSWSRTQCRAILIQARAMWVAGVAGDGVGWYQAQTAAARHAAILAKFVDEEEQRRKQGSRAADARAKRTQEVAFDKDYVLSVACRHRSVNPALSVSDIAAMLHREFPDRSESTYRKWLAGR